VYLVNGANRKEVPNFPIALDFDANEKWQLEGKMFGMEDFSAPISFDDGQAEKTFVVTLQPKAMGAGVAAPLKDAVPTTPKAAPEAPAEAAKPKEPAANVATGDAFLNINSLPASTVTLDGKTIGATPRLKVPVMAGTHTVLFVNAAESLKKSVSVTVTSGETKAVSAKLRD
jgi:serine/threonine-protein kinase